MAEGSDIPATPEGFEERRLCPDGSCVGVMGPNGVCRECGKRGDPVEDDWREEEPLEERDSEGDEAAAEAGSTESEGASGSFDPDRKLCPDGSCIGVIGSDGRCRQCGKQV
jgi:hypothetical protein